ncbi:hypothetical protein [Bosea sp. 685]|uniref:hypothetical protein n=1 Tax=Bosea sp. 685 TaxID=3080057 RepID=UPI002893704A|nr:hypothetical protein [Bosea sp. 685]WNJ88448.1 hypothetical protein RMR04_18760 [Bosea sp. 685]
MAWVPGVRPAAAPANLPKAWRTPPGTTIVVTRNTGAGLRIGVAVAGFVASYRANAFAAWSNPPDSSLDFRVYIEIGTQHQAHAGVPNLNAGPMPSGKCIIISGAQAVPLNSGIGPVLVHALAVYARRHGITWIRTGITANPWWFNFLGGDPLNPGGDFNTTANVEQWSSGRAAHQGWAIAPVTNHHW